MICFCYEHKLGFAKGIPGVPSRYTTSYVTKIVLARVDADRCQQNINGESVVQIKQGAKTAVSSHE